MSSTFKLNLEITSKYKNNEYIFRHGSKVGPVTNVDANVKYHEFIQNKVKYIAAKIREQTCVRAFDSKAEMRVTKYKISVLCNCCKLTQIIVMEDSSN